ncbi:glutamine-hydrolyzing carbamoyl-phosphate synthase small subunit [Acidiphilium sp. AL]|uniref:Carbamoyl phosphate synthase small chain n=1 Tax=Acidiphilium iwatense TaxID=768198 RepID=A0ABS9DW69_9PROT|nr:MULTISPECIES: glutamine-hydrolyzing carbamoyl-phosphate synthase small subunit [Acidiphilium]MCF3946981.1 glutamine-hydrolyzing carbamoyl-phosphate synthase small subunit [Acidiphilium iwatense]MCU4160343.1 glutamine-hydrolyzing carbamoyl-phosphate synthase small subunit [Acidiphilium sp. AL]
MPMTIAELIDRLGGPEAAAKLTTVSTEAVRKWRSAGAIPSRHWPAVLAATGLTLDDLPGGVAPPAETKRPDGATAALVLGDGRVFWGCGFGTRGQGAPAELCFSTGMTGYQETLTDPSFAGQIITFTFPHIGNVGANAEDIEASASFARGLVLNRGITAASNWRATEGLDRWCRRMGLAGIAGVDTRALTRLIRDDGPPNALIAFPEDGRFDIDALVAKAAAWPGLEGMDLAREVSCTQSYEWTETLWTREHGFGRQDAPKYTVVAVDYGAKRNILRNLASAGCRVIVVPGTSGADDILRHKPDGVFLSNGPGDPAATAEYAVPAIKGVLDAGVPLFGICLGHQLLAHTLGGKTYKLARGHRGANQPVQELATRRVEITSQNHGFAVDDASLPEGVVVTHKSLFDGSNEGIACAEQKCFSVQYHPEASPGPSDANHLFRRFTAMMEAKV